MTEAKFRAEIARRIDEIAGELSGMRTVLAHKSLSDQDIKELRERAAFARSICAGLATESAGELDRRSSPSLLPR